MIRKSILCGLVLCLMLGMNVPFVSTAVLAEPVENVPKMIWLKAETFDPLTKEPYKERMVPDDEGMLVCLLQFAEHSSPGMMQSLQGLGVEVYDYIPEDTYIVRIPFYELELIKSLSGIRWIGPYLPEYKMGSSLAEIDSDSASTGVSVSIDLFPQMDDVVNKISRIANVAHAGKDRVYALVHKSDLERIAELPEVKWIEPIPRYGLMNDISVTITNVDDIWNAPYQFTGTGQTIAIADTGLDTGVDTGVPGSIHQDFLGRVDIDSLPIVPHPCILNGGDDGAADTGSGHGTHVAGSAVGDGWESQQLGEDVKGAAFDAFLYFQAIEQWTVWDQGNPLCPNLPPDFYLTGIPQDLNDLFLPAYLQAARIHSNSWGNPSAMGEYTDDAQEVDEFAYNNRDMTILFSAGNSGEDADSNGEVDMNSVGSPGTAKNIITVGASEILRNRFTEDYGLFVCDAGPPVVRCFPVDPINSDTMDDEAEGMAAFSSRGWTDDGRVKPDLVAPGTWILSTRSSMTLNDLWGTPPWGGYPFAMTPFYTFSGGTSMATPMVAGAAALVREWYIDEGLINPSAALIKAALINGAVDMTGQYTTGGDADGNGAAEFIPNEHEGWGRLDLLGSIGNQVDRMYWDEYSGIPMGGRSDTRTIDVVGSVNDLKVTLVWTDMEGSTVALPSLVNDLTLRLKHVSSNTCYYGNHFFLSVIGPSTGWTIPQDCDQPVDINTILFQFDQWPSDGLDDTNNVENVYIQSPPTGVYEINVWGSVQTSLPQTYSLVVSGDLGNVPPEPVTNLNAELSPDLQDVILTWELSANDPFSGIPVGPKDVVEYRVHHRDGTLEGDYFYVDMVPAGVSTYTHVGAGVSGLTDFWTVVAVDSLGLTAYDVNQRAVKFHKSLQYEAVLFSLPVIPNDPSTQAVMSTIVGDYCVEWYNAFDENDHWKEYCSFKPYDDLPTLDPKMGLWIHSYDYSPPQDFVVAGRVPPNYEITLDVGWNHVGYPSFESVYMEISLTGICYDSIERFDPNSPPTYLQVADPMVDEFEPGEGYWIDMQWIPPGPCGVFWVVSNNMGNINLV